MNALILSGGRGTTFSRGLGRYFISSMGGGKEHEEVQDIHHW